MPHTRAVSADQKNARRTAILQAAAQLFEQTPYDQILMQQIAGRAGLAKGTLFLYFESKEHLFLSLTAESLNEWLNDLCAELRSATPPLMTLVFTRLVERSLRRLAAPSGQSLLLRLLGLHPHRLAEKLTSDALTQLNYSLHSSIKTTSTLMENLLPYLSPGQGEVILRRIIALLIGLPGSVTLTPAEDSAIDEITELAAALNLQLYALETLHRRKSTAATTAN
ncbi:MAG: helix-turn-helix domain-containing protein [Chloroflexota bacterium]